MYLQAGSESREGRLVAEGEVTAKGELSTAEQAAAIYQ
jgi:hypothetical protein